MSASVPDRIIILRISGFLAASAIGTPKIAVVASVVQLLINFIHFAERISDAVTAVPEWDKISLNHSYYLASNPRELGCDAHSFDLFPKSLVLPFDVDVAGLVMGVLAHIFA